MADGQFKNAVGRYLTEGDREVIDEILWHFRNESATDENVPATFVADKISKTSAPERRFLGFEHSALPEFRAAIEEGLGINIFEEPDLKTLVNNAGTVRNFLGDKFDELAHSIGAYHGYLPLLNHIIIPALEHALSNADPFREERAVVSYIKRAFHTEYTRLLAEYNGLKRLGRRDKNGNFYNLFVEPRPAHAWSIVFDRRVEDVEVAALLDRLTKTQRGYAERAYEVASRDIERGELDEYRIDEGGNYRIKFRYMADQLGVEESNLRKTFGKIRERTAENVPISAYKDICKGA